MKNSLFSELVIKHKNFVKSLNKNQKKVLYVLEFFILLNLLLSPVYLLWYYNHNLMGFNKLTADVSSFSLNQLGISSEVSTQYGGFSVGVEDLLQMFISNSCSGIIPIFLLFGLIFALPESKLKKKTKYFILFFPVIYFMNIFRIVTTAMVGLNFGINAFDFVHNILWSYLMILTVLVLWTYFVFKEKLKLTY